MQELRAWTLLPSKRICATNTSVAGRECHDWHDWHLEKNCFHFFFHQKNDIFWFCITLYFVFLSRGQFFLFPGESGGKVMVSLLKTQFPHGLFGCVSCFRVEKRFISRNFDYWPLSCCFFKEIVKDSWEACDGVWRLPTACGCRVFLGSILVESHKSHKLHISSSHPWPSLAEASNIFPWRVWSLLLRQRGVGLLWPRQSTQRDWRGQGGSREVTVLPCSHVFKKKNWWILLFPARIMECRKMFFFSNENNNKNCKVYVFCIT